MEQKENKTLTVVEAYLAPDQNILDQEPFIRIPTEVLPRNFFKNPEDKYAYGLLMKAVIHTPEGSFGAEFGSGTRLYKLRNLVTKWDSGVAVVAAQVKEHLLQFPYAQQYLKVNWEPHLFQTSGEPRKHKSTVLIPTFDSYQARLLASDRVIPWDGLEEVLPGLSTVESVRSAIPRKRPVNRIYRFRAGIKG